MKKLIAPAFVLAIGIVTAGASADQPVAVSRITRMPVAAAGVFKPYAVTAIKGEITVPAPSTFERSGYGNPASMKDIKCSDLIVTASSKDQKTSQAPPGGFQVSEPVWTRSAHAAGDWASGKCSYQVSVPPVDAFSLNVGTSGQFQCDYVTFTLSNQPAFSVGVEPHRTKVDNFAISKVVCGLVG